MNQVYLEHDRIKLLDPDTGITDIGLPIQDQLSSMDLEKITLTAKNGMHFVVSDGKKEYQYCSDLGNWFIVQN